MPTNSGPENPPETTRQRIIAAAMQLFGQTGYSQASTRAIAEAAGVNEVTLFRHFGNKKNLLMACIEAHNAAGFSATFETQLTGDYAQDILCMAQLQIEDTVANLDILRLLLCESRNVPELREAMLAGSRGNLGRLSRYFQRQIEAGVIRPDIHSEVLASAFDSLFSSNVLFEILFQDSLSPRLPAEGVIGPLVDLFVQGTRAVGDRSK
jgi:AcrR family transcriptional regulator